MTMRTHAVTRTDSTANQWAIDDDVVQLREWGRGKVHLLPEPPVQECTVGAAEACGLRLDDPSHLVSRLHARLVRDGRRWILRDGDSKNGLRLDGARRREIVLEPGLEIGVGGITLIAESPLSIALRGFLARLLGWGSDQTESVDHALRSVRVAGGRRAAVVLYGEGDLVPIAQSLHRHVRGADRRFVLCDPRRQASKATARSAETCTTAMEALSAAVGGSLCVRARQLPPDFHQLVEVLRAPNARVQLIVCTDAPEDCETYSVIPIVIPPLADRKADLDRIINEYAADAMIELAGQRSGFSPADLAWVREHASASLPEIEKATLRLAALRISRSLSDAAARLGMAPVSLVRWIGRRDLPMKIIR